MSNLAAVYPLYRVWGVPRLGLSSSVAPEDCSGEDYGVPIGVVICGFLLGLLAYTAYDRPERRPQVSPNDVPCPSFP